MTRETDQVRVKIRGPGFHPGKRGEDRPGPTESTSAAAVATKYGPDTERHLDAGDRIEDEDSGLVRPHVGRLPTCLKQIYACVTG